jgi:endogenous inhibitor of DNA gyrase (YacG/DUF329 family)
MPKCLKCNNLCCLTKTCDICGKEYITRPNKINIARFCSKSCKSINAGKMSAGILWNKWQSETPEQTKEAMKRALDRFIIKKDGCWEWSGYKVRKHKKLDYGRIDFRGRVIAAHRFSYEIYKGPIPRGQIIMHTCDNPPCTNPDHLILGTHLSNHRDMVNKGRGVRERLDEHKVKEIKKLLSTDMPVIKIAELFNVSNVTIYQIKNKQMWKWVED